MMSDMTTNDNGLEEIETTETEFDAMWTQAQPVEVRSGRQAVKTTFGTLFISGGGGVASGQVRRPGTHLVTTSGERQLAHAS